MIDEQEILNSMNENCCRDYMPQQISNWLYLEPIITDDILLEMRRLKHDKSPAHDRIGSKDFNHVLRYSQRIWFRYGELKTENTAMIWKLRE